MTPYQDWMINLSVASVTFVLVALVVLIHYEGLSHLNQKLASIAQDINRTARRRVVMYSICAVIGLHIIEIWLFGISYNLLQRWPEMGFIHTNNQHHFFDDIYFAATVFSSVGFGDLVPVGPIRFLAGTEGLVGLVLIGWSASFTYLEMQRYWPQR